MGRPVIISDCDEVLLHMLVPFRAWLDEAHDIHFAFGTSFEEAFRHKTSTDLIARDVIWSLLCDFFMTEMDRQQPIAGAMDAMARLGTIADIVVLTNIQDHRAAARAAQLARHGLVVPVFCNQGGKGPAVARLLAERTPDVAVFIDDLETNHASVAVDAPQVWRLHMVGEPELAPMIASSPDAHARIDHWIEAEGWIARRLLDVPPADE